MNLLLGIRPPAKAWLCCSKPPSWRIHSFFPRTLINLSPWRPSSTHSGGESWMVTRNSAKSRLGKGRDGRRGNGAGYPYNRSLSPSISPAPRPAPHPQSHAAGPVPRSPVHTPTAPSFKDFVVDSTPHMATRRQQWHMSSRPTLPCSQPPPMEFAKQISPGFFSPFKKFKYT